MKPRTVLTRALRARFPARRASLVVGALAIGGLARAGFAQEPAAEVVDPAAVEPTPDATGAEPAGTVAPLSPTEFREDVGGELQTVVPSNGAIIDFGIEDLFPDRFNEGRADLRDRGFDVGFAYTALYQQASGGPGDRNAAGGDVDLFGAWRLVGTPGMNPGTLVWAADNRHALFDDLTPGELGPQLGTLFGTSDGFNEREFALRQLFWQQTFGGDTLTLSVGKLDAGNYYNGSRASNDNLLALNQAFSANPARFFPQEGLGVNVRITPEDACFISAGVHDANADGEETGFNTAFDGDYFYAGELGLTPKLNGNLEGIYRFAAWYNDSPQQYGLESGWGVGVSATQFITETAGVALRYGWQDSDDVKVEQVFSAQYLAFVGGARPKDVWGVGAGWGRPSDGELDDEYVAEVFYRIQLTRNAQITPDVQVIVNPSNAPDDDAIAVFGLRFRTAF